MKPSTLRLTSAQLSARVAKLKLSEGVLTAVHAVVVNGTAVYHAATASNVTAQAVYRVLRQLAESGTTSMTVTCPTARAEQLRGLIKWQLAKWKADDAAAEMAAVAAGAQSAEGRAAKQ